MISIKTPIIFSFQMYLSEGYTERIGLKKVASILNQLGYPFICSHEDASSLSTTKPNVYSILRSDQLINQYIDKTYNQRSKLKVNTKGKWTKTVIPTSIKKDSQKIVYNPTSRELFESLIYPVKIAIDDTNPNFDHHNIFCNKFRYEIIRNQSLKSQIISISMSTTLMEELVVKTNLKMYLDIAPILFQKIKPEYCAVGLSRFPELNLNSDRILNEQVPNLTYANWFGPTLVRKIGRKFLENAPGSNYLSLPGGRAYYEALPVSLDLPESSIRKRKKQVLDYFKKNCGTNADGLEVFLLPNLPY